MADKYLDLAGLNYLWGKITTYVDGAVFDSSQLGIMDDTNGLYYPKDIIPEAVGNNSLLITDTAGLTLGTRSLSVATGYGLTLKTEAAAGATQYQIENTYENRIVCSELTGGVLAIDEASASFTVPIVSVTIDGQAFTPDSSADDTTTPIIITTSASVNPDSAISSIRVNLVEGGQTNLYVGHCVGGGGSDSIVAGRKVTNYSNAANALVGQNIYNTGGGSAVFGMNHINKKARAFLAGIGHDTSSGSEGVAAVGKWSDITSTTAFVVGGGSGATDRGNLFEITSSGDAIAKGNITSTSGSRSITLKTSGTAAGLYDDDLHNYLLYGSTGDNWLYLNRGNIYTSGIYCGTKTLRTDGVLRVGTGTAPYTDITGGSIYVNGAANSQTGVTCYSGSNANCIYIETETDGRVVLGSRTNDGTWCNIVSRANNSTEITAGGTWTMTVRPWHTGIAGRPVISDGADSKRVDLLSCSSSTQLLIQGQWATTGTNYSNRYVTVSTSDIRLKENVKDSTVSALPVINSIKMREFDWKEDGKHQDLGFVADELEEINPNFSMGGGYTEDGVMDVKCVDTFNLTAYLTKAVQELSIELNKSKTQINELKQEVSELKNLIKNYIQTNQETDK